MQPIIKNKWQTVCLSLEYNQQISTTNFVEKNYFKDPHLKWDNFVPINRFMKSVKLSITFQTVDLWIKGNFQC